MWSPAIRAAAMWRSSPINKRGGRREALTNTLCPGGKNLAPVSLPPVCDADGRWNAAAGKIPVLYASGLFIPQGLCEDLCDVLEMNAPEKYYMSAGYWETLKRHKARQKKNGNGYGYVIVNRDGIEHPIANTLLATGGSGKERNLIVDYREGISGKEIKGKHSPLNSEGIRVMTPREWGKLQGFINYAFVENGQDKKSGAGQYFTPRALIKAMVEVRSLVGATVWSV